jgi:hypothetical protein
MDKRVVDFFFLTGREVSQKKPDKENAKSQEKKKLKNVK